MALVLKVLTAGDSSLTEGETRGFDGASFSIGRGAENDWIVSDPNRHLSKQHCRLERRGSSYFIIDTSTNGVYVGDAVAPLGKGNTQPLRDGDVVNLGPCSLGVAINEPAAVQATPARSIFGDTPSGVDSMMDSAPVAYGAGSTSVSDILGGRRHIGDPLDSHDREMVDSLPDTGFTPFEIGPGTANHFEPPAVQRAVIPVDWHADDEGGVLTEPPAVPAVTEPEEPAIVRPAFPRPTPRAVVEEEPVAAPAPKPGEGPTEVSVVERPSDPVEAFMAGLGLPLDALDNADHAALMHKVGLAFREAVGGLRELLELRAFLKSEFRIEHTLLRAKENNPLKFSANLDGTLAVLIGRRVTGFMDAPEAIRESLRDIKAHEVALIAGMKTVVGDVLEQLSPETVSADVGSSLLPQVHKARCWEKYEQTHQRIMGEQSSGPPLGGKFSAAYTKQFRSL